MLANNDYNGLLYIPNASFRLAIKKCYCDFIVIGSPIITRDVIDSLVEIYKSKMKNHYHTTYLMMGYKQKIGMTQNKHLLKSE